MHTTEDLLEYYRRELAFLRVQGADFAARYPRVAQRLALDGAESPDPHTERLLESFAFLSGRIHRDLDRQFPIVAEALLQNLCPVLAQPVPSMTVVQMRLEPTQGRVNAGLQVRRGTLLSVTAPSGDNCRWRTAWDNCLWPLRVHRVRLEDERTLCLDLQCDEGCDVGDLALDVLRIHLGGDALVSMPLHDMLVGSLEQVCLQAEDGVSTPMGRHCWRQMGLDAAEAVLPGEACAHPAYSLLREYFCFPRKFLFFELSGLRPHLRAGRSLSVRLVFSRSSAVLSQLTPAHFLLGCVPAINLFEQGAESILLDHRHYEYRLVPERQRESSTEVHSVLDVTLSQPGGGKPQPVPSVYAEPDTAPQTHWRWLMRRESSLRKGPGGSDVFLGFVDLSAQPWPPAKQIVHVRTLCTNGLLAAQVPAGARLHAEGVSSSTRVHCLYPPAAQRTAVLGSQTLWSLVSLLRLNHGSLVSGSAGVQPLRQWLMLFAGDGMREQAQVRGITGLRSQPALARIGHEVWRGHCRGTQVWLDVDETAFVGGSCLLLGSVLARFLALYTSANAFVQLSVMQGDALRMAWPAMAGEQCLI